MRISEDMYKVKDMELKAEIAVALKRIATCLEEIVNKKEEEDDK